MTDWDAVMVTLYDWADAQLGVPVIWADQNAAPPASAYVTMRVASSTRIGDDMVGPPDASTAIADITGNRDFTLFIQALGTGAKSNVEKLRTSLQKPTALDLLRSGGVVFVQEVGAVNVTAIVPGTTKYESRETLDVMMRVASAETDDLGKIEHAEVDVEILDPAGSTVVDETITIN